MDNPGGEALHGTARHAGLVSTCITVEFLVSSFLIVQTKLKQLWLPVTVCFVLLAMIQPFVHFTSSHIVRVGERLKAASD